MERELTKLKNDLLILGTNKLLQVTFYGLDCYMYRRPDTLTITGYVVVPEAIKSTIAVSLDTLSEDVPPLFYEDLTLDGKTVRSLGFETNRENDFQVRNGELSADHYDDSSHATYKDHVWVTSKLEYLARQVGLIMATTKG